MDGLSTERLDELITHCLNDRNMFSSTPEYFTADEIATLCQMAKRTLIKDESMLQLSAPIYIIGDLHGQFVDLLRYLDQTDITKDKYLFLGDYVDRGPRPIEIVILVFALKVRYPDRFFLLRGNHEDETINRLYGFYDECLLQVDDQLMSR